jgi:hypothetical protein
LGSHLLRVVFIVDQFNNLVIGLILWVSLLFFLANVRCDQSPNDGDDAGAYRGLCQKLEFELLNAKNLIFESESLQSRVVKVLVFGFGNL